MSAYMLQDIIITDNIISEHLSERLSIHRIQEILNFRDTWKWLEYFIIPITYSVKFVLITLWLLSGTIIFNYKISFNELFRVVLSAEFIRVVPSVLTVFWFAIVDNDYTLVDVQYFQPLSLLNLFSADSLEPWLVPAFRALNIFEIIYMVGLAIGIRKVINQDLNESLKFVLTVQGFGLLTWVIFITFLSFNVS